MGSGEQAAAGSSGERRQAPVRVPLAPILLELHLHPITVSQSRSPPPVGPRAGRSMRSAPAGSLQTRGCARGEISTRTGAAACAQSESLAAQPADGTKPAGAPRHSAL